MTKTSGFRANSSAQNAKVLAVVSWPNLNKKKIIKKKILEKSMSNITYRLQTWSENDPPCFQYRYPRLKIGKIYREMVKNCQ